VSEFVSPRTFCFLRELAAHNERAWFERNKQRYLLGPGLSKLSRRARRAVVERR
jgi:uncharacterized protein (DUF2461 family)